MQQFTTSIFQIPDISAWCSVDYGAPQADALGYGCFMADA
jgi:hypothetical protein